ncbi:hypothetical protein ATP53_25780, partial [Salmonella enterica]|nr:hypothetical protein [Salmonella enterica]
MVVHDSKTQSPQEIYQAETPEEAAMLLKAVQDERQRCHKSRKNFLLSYLMLILLILIGVATFTMATSYIRQDEINTPQRVPAISLLKPARNEPVSVDIAAAPLAAVAQQKSVPVAPSIQVTPDDSRVIRAASLKK